MKKTEYLWDSLKPTQIIDSPIVLHLYRNGDISLKIMNYAEYYLAENLLSLSVSVDDNFTFPIYFRHGYEPEYVSFDALFIDNPNPVRILNFTDIPYAANRMTFDRFKELVRIHDYPNTYRKYQPRKEESNMNVYIPEIDEFLSKLAKYDAKAYQSAIVVLREMGRPEVVRNPMVKTK